jgi:hypothetical protein
MESTAEHARFGNATSKFMMFTRQRSDSGLILERLDYAHRILIGSVKAMRQATFS